MKRNWCQRWSICVLVFGGALLASVASAQAIDPAKLTGIVIDDAQAVLTGEWKDSTHVKPYVGDGYQHDDNAAKGERQARFTAKIPKDGTYQVLLGYTSGGSRASNVPVTIHASEAKTVTVNQRQVPAFSGFADLGQFKFTAAQGAAIVVSNEGTNGHVIIDAVQIVTPDQFKLVQENAKKPVKVAQPKPETKKPAAQPRVKFEKAPPPQSFTRLSTEQLETLLAAHLGNTNELPLVSDELFLRRVTHDIVGRQPTVQELEKFLADPSADRRAATVERLLASAEYGGNWANYWSDAIAARQQEPELTFHDYTPFKTWLAQQFNSDRRWDEMTFEMLTAQGKVGENPAGTFIAFHQADALRLAGETSRVFLSVQIACAECHDHPFVDMPQETFHGMAAFFARTQASIPQNDSSQIDLKSKDKGEHKIPGKKGEMQPVALGGMDGEAEYQLGLGDIQRRTALANWIVQAENPFYARAYVNRVWARLMGRGFYEPVDEMGELADDPILRDVHAALAEHFVASGYDHKDLVRLITSTRAYQRSVVPPDAMKDNPLAAARFKKLRGDEVFDSLVTAIALPNYTPPKEKKTGAVRFPVPPKSTRDLVNDAFGYDPSFKDDLLVRTMKQAMFMMNNEQLQTQINAAPDSGTFLAKLLAEETDDNAAVVKLHRAVLGRSPNEHELGILTRHLAAVNNRGEAFEDVLWSLINSAEFTTRR